MPGLDYAYYEGTWSALPDFAALTPVATGAVANADISVRLRDDIGTSQRNTVQHGLFIQSSGYVFQS